MSLSLSEKQKAAMTNIKVNGCITNKAYRELNESTIWTASRDLDDLISKGVVEKVGTTGHSTHYFLTSK